MASAADFDYSRILFRTPTPTMHPNRLTTALALLFSAALTPALAAAPDKPYTVAIWATVEIGAEGTVTASEIKKEADYPAPFIAAVNKRIAALRIDPPTDAGAPATLRSGLLLSYTVTPSATGGSVSLDSMNLSPLPVREHFAPYPRELTGPEDWKGKLTVSCLVGVDGLCGTIDVVSDNGVLPEPARRFARDSLQKWKFEPQRLNGKPVEARFSTVLDMTVEKTEIKDFRDPTRI